MARSKSYSEVHVLTQATDLFWIQGYKRTSMCDLEKATGLTAGSIYHEFGSKIEFFKRCLNFYNTKIMGERVEKYLTSAPDPLEGIYQLLVTLCDDPYSCLLINTAMEFGQTDQNIGMIVNKGIRKLTLSIQEALESAKTQGTLKQDMDTEVGAHYIGIMIPGLQLYAKNRAMKSQIEDVIKLQLSTLIG